MPVATTTFSESAPAAMEIRTRTSAICLPSANGTTSDAPHDTRTAFR